MDKSVSEAVAATLKELGLCADPLALVRTVLIRDGHFLGYKYRFDGGCAVWLPGEKVIEVYDQEGKLLQKVGVEAGGDERVTAA